MSAATYKSAFMKALAAEIVANNKNYKFFKILMGFILVLHEKQTYFLTKIIIFPLISNETTSSNYNKELHPLLVHPSSEAETANRKHRRGRETGRRR
jgi:hypothetical protein